MDTSASGDILIDSRDANNVVGAVPDFWKLLIDRLSSKYNIQIGLEWYVVGTSQDAFAALYDGRVDANCGLWFPSGVWTNPTTGNTVARPLSFSMMQCPAFLKSAFIFTPIDSGIDSFASLVSAVEAAGSAEYNVCVAGKFIEQADARTQPPRLLTLGFYRRCIGWNGRDLQSDLGGKCARWDACVYWGSTRFS